MLKQYFLDKTKRPQHLSATLIVLVVAAIGTYLLTGSHAASPYVSTAADSGTLTGVAAKQSCSGASDGTCVTFGGSTNTGSGKTWYVATTGSDSNPCTQSSPCLSFNRAYDVAAPGDTVQVAGGVYDTPWTNAASQTLHGELISWDASKTSTTSKVTFVPVSGASVTVNGNIRVMSSDVAFENMSLVDPANSNIKGDVEAFNYDPNGIPANHNVGYITFQNITGRNFNIYATHDVSILGGSYGPSSACETNQPSLTQYGGGNNALRPQPGAPDPSTITIDGVTVHNIMSYDLVGCHTEGIAIFSGSNVTIKNSKFYGDDIYDVLSQANSGSGSLGQITFENNWFGQPTNGAGQGTAQSGVEFDDNANITVDNNTFDAPFTFLAGPSFSNVTIVGNITIGPDYAASSNGSMCGASGVTAQYNFTQKISGLDCTTATNVELSSIASLLTNTSATASMNFNLLPGSQALNFVPTSATIVTNDIDYHCRPTSGQTKDDAGASELNATGSCGNPTQ